MELTRVFRSRNRITMTRLLRKSPITPMMEWQSQPLWRGWSIRGRFMSLVLLASTGRIINVMISRGIIVIISSKQFSSSGPGRGRIKVMWWLGRSESGLSHVSLKFSSLKSTEECWALFCLTSSPWVMNDETVCMECFRWNRFCLNLSL